MNDDAAGAPPSLTEAVRSVAVMALIVWVVVSWVQMPRRTAWLTYVVVASGPFAENMRLERRHLRYSIRLVDRALHPLERLEEAEGRYLTAAAVKRCPSPACDEMPLTRDDVAVRPAAGASDDVYAAVAAAPWRADDFRVGDKVYVVASDAPARPPAAGRDSPEGPFQVPNAGDAPGAGFAANRSAPAAQATRPPAFEPQLMQVVGIASGAAGGSVVLYLTPDAGSPAPQADLLVQLRLGTLRVASIAPSDATKVGP